MEKELSENERSQRDHRGNCLSLAVSVCGQLTTKDIVDCAKEFYKFVEKGE